MRITTIALLAPLLAALLIACEDVSETNKAKPQQTSQAVVVAYEEKLTSAVPYPLDRMNDSLERRNLREKLLRFNDPSKIGYVYLLTDFGQIVAYYTIKGKVSSTQSQLTITQQTRCIPIQDREDPCFIVDSVSDDGSYGLNEDGVFFFTTEDVFITWNGAYLYSDYPLDVKDAALFGYDPATAAPSSTGENQ
jgi:hypothetical protein